MLYKIRRKNYLGISLLLALIILAFPSRAMCQEEAVGNREGFGLEDGFYTVEIELMHADAERPSMGNASLNKQAEVRVQEGQAFLYLESKKIEVQNIVASLRDLYYLKDGVFYSAEKADYSLEIPGEERKKPSVFQIPLEDRSEIIWVLVDPQVEPMGDDPIKARLQIKWDTIKSLSEEKGPLYERFLNPSKILKFDKTQGGQETNKGVVLQYQANSFDEEFYFYANRLKGEEAEEYQKLFKPTIVTEFYKIEFLSPVTEIKEATVKVKEERRKLSPKENVEIKFPIKTIEASDNPSLYKIEDKELKEIPYDHQGDYLVIKDKEGYFVIANDGKRSQEGPANTPANTPADTPAAPAEEAAKPQIKQAPPANAPKVKSSPQASSKVKPSQASNQAVQAATSPLVEASKPLDQNPVGEETKENMEEGKEDRIPEPRESKAIILSITVVLLAVNLVCSIILIRNLGRITEIAEEIKELKG